MNETMLIPTPTLLPEFETRIEGSRQFPMIVGYAAVWHDGTDATETRIDDNKFERIHPGAFRSALERGDDPRALLNHDPNLLLGRRSAGTLRVFEDGKGLRYEIDPPRTQLGRQVTESIRRGDMRGASFAFKAERQELRDEVRAGQRIIIRNLLQVGLGDVSLATFPAYTGSTAALQGGESASSPRLDMARRRLLLIG